MPDRSDEPAGAAPKAPAIAEPAPAAAPQADPKAERARAVYAAWRNEYLGAIPTEVFNRIEASSEALVEAIAALL